MLLVALHWILQAQMTLLYGDLLMLQMGNDDLYHLPPLRQTYWKHEIQYLFIVRSALQIMIQMQ